LYEATYKMLDTNLDGKISLEEYSKLSELSNMDDHEKQYLMYGLDKDKAYPIATIAEAMTNSLGADAPQSVKDLMVTSVAMKDTDGDG
jgi:hypothetical protein